METIHNARSTSSKADMSQSLLARLAGPLALGAGTLLTVVQIALFAILDRSQRAASMAHPLFVPSAIAHFVAYCTILLALVAVHEWQARRTNTFGVIGFVAALIGTTCMAGDMWFEAFAVPWIGDVAFDALTQTSGTLVLGALITYVLFSLGWVLFAVASLRARTFPAAIASAILVGGAILPWSPVPSGVLLALAFAWLGVWILRTSAASEHPEPVTV